MIPHPERRSALGFATLLLAGACLSATTIAAPPAAEGYTEARRVADALSAATGMRTMLPHSAQEPS